MRWLRILSLICGAACAVSVAADTRVELIGRVDFNGLQLGNCFTPPCPWQNVRPGEYVYVTFLVNDAAPHDISANWPDCPNQFPRTIGDFVYDIRDGTMYARAGGVSLGIPITQGQVYTAPAFRVVNDNCAVDVIEIQGAIMGRGGRCCYASGACTYVKESDCQGVWTIDGPCSPIANSCIQPLGACCAGDGTCTTSIESSCAGTWTFGPCQPAPCFSEPVGSCCETSGACVITVQTQCAALWTDGGTCSATTCTRPGLLPDYAMDITLRGPKTLFTSSDILQNLGLYPTSALAPDRSWTVIFQSSEMFIYAGTTIRFSDDTTPTGSCCPGDGHCLVTTQAICPVTSSWVSGGSCGPTTCPSGSGACCKPDGSCELLTSAACAAIVNAVYQLDGSSCGPATCPPTGACCVAGSCSVIIQSACVATAGSWLGAGTTCAVLPEYSFAQSIVAGACCLASNGSCSLKYPTACSGVGQTWTPGTCSVPCPGTGAGACCNNSTGACSIVTAANCTNINATWTGAATCDAPPCTNLNGDPVGPCCNAVAGSCTVVVAAACTSGNVWSASGTCATVCSAGTGSCCNTLDGSCSIRTQSFCTGSTVWTSGATCDVPCVGSAAIIPDAIFTSGQPDTPGTYTNTQSVSDPSVIQSVEVWLDITMTRMNDLKVRLTGPNGATVELFTRIDAKPPLCVATPIGPGRVMSGVYSFQDSAAQSLFGYISTLATGVGPVPGRYKPAGCGGSPVSLNAAFAGITASGNWTLTVIDERSGTSAQLRTWGLSFNGGSPGPCTLGKCENGASCSNTTFAQCTTGVWSVGSCSPITCPSGTPGACCIFDVCAVVCASQCPTSAGAMFAGSGSVCSPTACQTACCLASGACTITLPINCNGSAGPLFSVCSPNACVQPVACCYPSGGCILSLASSCTGGTPGSPGTSCSPNTCPRPAPPANDACATVAATGPDISLDSAGLWLSSGATLVGAREDAGLPSCGSGLPSADIWFRFTPPASGSFRFQTCNTSPVWDTVISLWSDCTTQIPGACADDSCGTSPTVYGHATLNSALSAGAPLLVRVSAFAPNTTNVGAATLRVEALGACCNSAGVCSLNTQAACTAISTATFRGLYTSCTPNPCPQPRACCNATTNSCQLVAPSGCTGGRIVGPEGSTCTPFNPCPVGTCCRGATCSTSLQQGQCTGLYETFVPNVITCNVSGSTTTPCCYADYNKTDGISVQDIFDFLNDWFASSPFADTGSDGTTAPDVQSIFDFLNAWFAGGC